MAKLTLGKPSTINSSTQPSLGEQQTSMVLWAATQTLNKIKVPVEIAQPKNCEVSASKFKLWGI
jgi:hypothetical protein